MGKSPRLPIVAVLCACLALLAGRADARTAREILDASRETNDAREPDDVQQKMTMTLVDSRGGERVRELEVYTKVGKGGEDRSITFFTAPPEVRGVGFLSWAHAGEDDDQWLYLPALKRVRRITANARRQSFQGSDFTYEDLELFDEMPEWTEEDAESSLVRESEVVDEVPCAVIDLLPKKGDYEYARFRMWLHEADATVRRIDFFEDKSAGEPVKRLTLTGYRVVGEVPTPHRLEMVNERKGTKTIMEISEVKYDQGLDEGVFTQRTLERGKVR